MPRRASSPSLLLKAWIERIDEKSYSTNGKVVFCEVCLCNLQIRNYSNLQQHSASSKHSKNVAKRFNSYSDNSSSLETKSRIKNASSPEEKVDTRQFAPCCANCTSPCEGPSTGVLAELSFDQYSDEFDSKKKMDKPVTILEALGTIFGFKFYSDEADILKDRLILCSTCEKYLANIYQLFCEFKDLCHEESYISKNGIQQSLDTGLGTPCVRPQRRFTLLQNKNKLRISRMKEQKRRLKLVPQIQRENETSKSKFKEEELEPCIVASARSITTQRWSKSRPASHPIPMDEEDSLDEDYFDNTSDSMDLEYADPVVKDAFQPMQTRLGKNGGRCKAQSKNTPELTELRTDSENPQQNETKRVRGRPRKENVLDKSPKQRKAKDGKTKRTRGRPRKHSILDKTDSNSNKEEHKCLQCGKVATSNSNLQMHIRGVHEGVRRHQCATCKKVYACKSMLKNHVQVAHERIENQFICTVPGCGKSFPYPAGLHRHKFTHSAERKFACNVCHKRFKRPYDLKEHKRKHTTEKPFICEHCGSCFKSRNNLRNHVVIHDDKGRFKGMPAPTCLHCKKTFTSDWNRRVHIRTVHEKITPFKCPLCVKAFTCSSNLKVHLNGFHKCLRDANNKVILPTLPISHDTAWNDEDEVENPVNSAEETHRVPASTSEIRINNVLSIQAPHQGQTPIFGSFPHVMTSYFNYGGN